MRIKINSPACEQLKIYDSTGKLIVVTKTDTSLTLRMGSRDGGILTATGRVGGFPQLDSTVVHANTASMMITLSEVYSGNYKRAKHCLVHINRLYY
jgi:hypothetical protein